MKRIVIAVAALFLSCSPLLAQAISTIKGEQLENVPSAQLPQVLEGQIQGLGIIETSSEPGYANLNMYIRGISSNGTTTPIFVVDGVIMQNYNIDFITAEEIESISVLKDASATAIYGLKAANGVILIKTRSGKAGAVKVRATVDLSLQQVGTKPQTINAEQYIGLRREGWLNDGARGEFNLTAQGDNDWYKRYVRSLATMQRAGVTVSGGSDRVRAWANVNFMNQTSIMRQETDAYRTQPNKTWINFRAKTDIDITKWLSADVQIAGDIQNNRMASDSKYDNALYNSLFNLPPSMGGPLTEDGQVVTVESVPYPTYGLLNRSGYTKLASAYLFTAAGLKFDFSSFAPGLSLSGKVAYQSSNDRYNYSKQSFSKFFWDEALEKYVQLGSDINSNLKNSVQGRYQYNITYFASLDYDHSFGKHKVGARLYNIFNEELRKTMEADFPAAGMSYYDHNFGLQLSYAYDRIVDCGVNLAFNGSDSFDRKNRYAFTPTAFVNYRPIEALNLRVSGGLSSSDTFQSTYLRYMYRDYIKWNGEIKMKGNPDLKAEMRKEINLGADATLPLGFSLTADYYYRRTDNMLISSGNYIPSYQGIGLSALPMINSGAMSNNGFEIALNWQRKFGDWRVNATFQWAHNRNKVINAGEVPYPDGYQYSHRVEGFPLGQKFGYLTDGYISNAQELATYTAMYSELGTPRLGDFKYKDLNADGLVNEKDMAPIGNGSCPTDFGTLRVGFGWKDLDFEMVFYGVTGWYGSVSYDTAMSSNGIYNDLHLNAWTAERAASGQKISAPALSYSSPSVSSLANDWNIENRSFLRLKNLAVSYRVCKQVKLVFSAQNLFTVSAMKSKTIDPETGSMTSPPLFRVFNLGAKMEF